ncbi:SOS-response repressor and protease LexA [Klebsiella grimontii]|uniref:SOS-response repressor and protease LexA n=1 Tax=Klebsiella grimontii TaxID=2058152 RepID=A0A7H4PC18_9ENTR|nr:SOS-response repressor and protease LexA [Klebsiella grimontii]
MKALTTRQQEVFDLIRDHISQTGMPPTRAEIAQRLGFRSPNAAEEHLKALARKGAIEIVSGRLPRYSSADGRRNRSAAYWPRRGR